MGEDHEDELTTILIRWNRTGAPLLLGTRQIIKTRNVSRRKKGDFGSRPDRTNNTDGAFILFSSLWTQFDGTLNSPVWIHSTEKHKACECELTQGRTRGCEIGEMSLGG